MQRRREFLETLIATLSASVLAGQTRSGDMLYRTLGKTGEKVSAVGLGGYHIGVPAEQEGIRIIRGAIDGGINFLDNCWSYNEGLSELRMGRALKDGYRQKVFLMTKFDGRTKAAAARQIDESLARLQTDHVDLMQFHENIRIDDPDRFFAEGGAVEAVVEARQAGKIRYIGFTGHKDPVIHLRMLEVAAQKNFHFDAAQMPLNILDASFRSFAQHVVPRLIEQGTAVLGMKPLAVGLIPQNKIATAIECLHYALSLPASVVISGCDSVERLEQTFEAVRTFKPLSAEQMAALVAKGRPAALTGKLERFKTTDAHDGTARNPQIMG